MCHLEIDMNCQKKDIYSVFSIKLLFKTIVHCVYLFINSFVNVYGIIIWVNITEEQQKEPLLKMLKELLWAYGTNWNYIIQTIFLILAVTYDILEWFDKHQASIAHKIKKWRDLIFTSLVVPYSCCVFLLFWGIYFIDRELVFPKMYDMVIPSWFNHCVHTNILVMVIVESLLQERRRPRNKKLELTIAASLSIAYAILYYSIYFITNRWLYNIFAVMKWWQIVLFQIGNWVAVYIFYISYFPLNRLIHGSDPDTQDEIKDKDEIKEREVVEKEKILKEDTLKDDEGTVKDGKLEVNEENFKNDNDKYTNNARSLKYRSISLNTGK